MPVSRTSTIKSARFPLPAAALLSIVQARQPLYGTYATKWTFPFPLSIPPTPRNFDTVYIYGHIEVLGRGNSDDENKSLQQRASIAVSRKKCASGDSSLTGTPPPRPIGGVASLMVETFMSPSPTTRLASTTSGANDYDTSTLYPLPCRL